MLLLTAQFCVGQKQVNGHVYGARNSSLRRKVLREGNLLIESLPSKGAIDHHSLAMYYEEQARLNKTKAQDWDFQADYDKKFPSAYSGKSTEAEHVACLCAVAEDFRQDAKRNEALAAQQRSLMRKDVIDSYGSDAEKPLPRRL